MENALVEGYVMLGFALTVIATRTALRITTVGFGKLCSDDFLMIIAAIVYVVETYLAWAVDGIWQGLANNGLTNDQRAALVEGSEEFRLRVGGSKAQIAVQSSYVALLWLFKCAISSFYWRVLGYVPGYRLRVIFAYTFVIVSWIAVQLTLLCGCIPIKRYWQINPDPGNFCQAAVSRLFLISCLILDVTTDGHLLILPLPVLWRTKNLPIAQKAGLTVIFSGGFIVIMCAVARNTILLLHSDTGARSSGNWAIRETFVAALTSNMPTIYSSARMCWQSRRNDG